MISKIASSSDENYLPAAKLLSALLFFSVSTPMIYQGEEIGMTDYPLSKSDLRRTDVDPYLFHARSSYQWDNNPNGAFTAAAFSAFPVNENYHKINLLAQSADQKSVFSFYRRMIAFRKEFFNRQFRLLLTRKSNRTSFIHRQPDRKARQRANAKRSAR